MLCGRLQVVGTSAGHLVFGGHGDAAGSHQIHCDQATRSRQAYLLLLSLFSVVRKLTCASCSGHPLLFQAAAALRDLLLFLPFRVEVVGQGKPREQVRC